MTEKEFSEKEQKPAKTAVEFSVVLTGAEFGGFLPTKPTQ